MGFYSLILKIYLRIALSLFIEFALDRIQIGLGRRAVKMLPETESGEGLVSDRHWNIRKAQLIFGIGGGCTEEEVSIEIPFDYILLAEYLLCGRNRRFYPLRNEFFYLKIAGSDDLLSEIDLNAITSGNREITKYFIECPHTGIIYF